MIDVKIILKVVVYLSLVVSYCVWLYFNMGV